MAEQVKRPVGITETVLRDAHQSLMATRMTTEQMLPIVEKMDQVGYHSVECWGGATFDASLRFLKEDPWERLRKLRAGFKNTKLQMLFRGQNILGYNHYADDVVEYFVQKSVANGMDIIRIFDCFNDLRNLKTAVNATKAIKKENPNAEAQIALCYTLGDAYTLDYWKKIAKEIESMGADSICIKVMVETFKGTPYDTGLDMKLLGEIADYFRPIQEEALKSGRINPKVMGVNIKTLMYQVPGGMLSNLVSQLKEAGAEDKYYQVLEEVPRVRKDFGEPPLVTPSSQIVGTQAVLNVLQGERYKMMTKESKKILRGEFGQTVKPFNKEVQKKAIGDEKPITCRPADLIKPQLDNFRKEAAQYIQQDEDVLTYALFPQVATDFFKYREAQQTKVDPAAADTKNKAYPV